jgi:hypothetical protein
MIYFLFSYDEQYGAHEYQSARNNCSGEAPYFVRFLLVYYYLHFFI